MKKTEIHNQNKDTGFTMIEVIITIAIVAIGMIAMMGLVFTVTKGNLHSKRVTTASIIAQDNLEKNLRKGYHDVVDEFGTNTAYDIDYYWVTTVLANTPGTDTKTVKADVYWSPGTTTSNHSISLQTVLAQ